MLATGATKWTYLGEFFEAVAEQGIDELEALEALLLALRGGVRARGYRRQFVIDGFDQIERLPRDVHPLPVPVAIWRDCGEPRGDLTCHWQDDPEKPEVMISVDWISGAVETLAWELNNFDQLRTDFSGIQIPRKEAECLLRKLAGSPQKRAGRPRGPSSDWEKQRVAVALNMIADGDTRPPTAIANSLTSADLTGKALESQRRRLAWGIKTALQSGAKDPHKKPDEK